MRKFDFALRMRYFDKTKKKPACLQITCSTLIMTELSFLPVCLKRASIRKREVFFLRNSWYFSAMFSRTTLF